MLSTAFKLFATVWLCTCCVLLANAQNNYSYTISTSEATQKLLRKALPDFAQQLKNATGREFTLSSTGTKSGIILQKLERSQSSSFDKRLNPDNLESALIQSDGKIFLKISAYTKQGLINGMYSYLHLLGFRWYQPGDAWTVIPKTKSVELKYDGVINPQFEMRKFWGTYGTPRNPIVDKEKIVDREWELWEMRNRLGGEINVKGHAGNEFLHRNIAVLKQHPEYMALIKNERSKPVTGAKFCSSNTGLQKLFVDDMVAELKVKMQSVTGQSVYYVSAEPSDGGGFCQCDKCKMNGGVSEQVFLLANLAAKEFQKISPAAFVSLYAYNTHIAPPSFALEKNVLVGVAPYKFQKYAKPNEVIEQWLAKTPNIYIRDYYALPAGNLDMPVSKQELDELLQKLAYWKQKKVKGLSVESSYSIGSTGIGGMLFARLAWTGTETSETVLNEYYTACFGKAAEVVKQAQNILSNEQENAWQKAALLVQQKTAGITLEPNQKICITHFKAYLHYLKLFAEWQQADKANIGAPTDRLLKYVWGIHYTMMVHPAAITSVLAKKPRSAAYIQEHWERKKKNGMGDAYSTVLRISNSEIEKLFEEDCKKLR